MPRKFNSRTEISPEVAALKAGDFVYRARFLIVPDLPEEIIYVQKQVIRKAGAKTLFIAHEQVWRNELHQHDWCLTEKAAVAALERRAERALKSSESTMARAQYELRRIAEWRPVPRKD